LSRKRKKHLLILLTQFLSFFLAKACEKEGTLLGQQSRPNFVPFFSFAKKNQQSWIEIGTISINQLCSFFLAKRERKKGLCPSFPVLNKV